MPYLLDTNVLSEPTKPAPGAKLVRWLADHDAEVLISVLTLGEIVKGIEMMATGKRRRQMEGWLEELEEWAVGRVLPVDEEVVRAWGRYYLAHGLTIASRNLDDFPNVPGVNPWE